MTLWIICISLRWFPIVKKFHRVWCKTLLFHSDFPSYTFSHTPSGILANDLTFSYAECVVPTCHKIIECNKEMGVIFTRAGEKVFLGVPASCFTQTLWLKVWHYRSLKGFWRRKREEKEKAGSFWLIKSIWPTHALWLSKLHCFMTRVLLVRHRTDMDSASVQTSCHIGRTLLFQGCPQPSQSPQLLPLRKCKKGKAPLHPSSKCSSRRLFAACKSFGSYLTAGMVRFENKPRTFKS